MECSHKVSYPSGWKEKRKSTLRIFIFLSFLHGVEWSMFFLVLWVYLKKIVTEESKVKLFYGVISTSYLVATITSMPLVGMVVDKSRRVKEALFIGNMLIIFGNLIFSLPYSQYFLLVGRILAGFGSSTVCIFSAELARSFEKDDVIKQICITSSAYIMGFVMGPCFGFAFTSIDIRLTDDFYITYGNASTLFLALCFLISTFFIPRCVFNISLEFDLKESLAKSSTEKIPLLPKKPAEKGGNNWNIIKAKFSFLCNMSLLVIYSLSTLYQSSLALFDMWIPMIITDYLKWTATEINLMFLGLSILTFLFITASNKLNPSGKVLFNILLVSIAATTILPWLLYGIGKLKKKSYSITLIVGFDIIYAFSAFVCTAIFPTSVANMVSSSNQALAESIRLVMGRIASCIALMTAPYLLQYVISFSVVITIFYCVCVVFVIYRRRYILESIR